MLGGWVWCSAWELGWTEAAGQSQARGGGWAVLSAHTQASWHLPRGPLISRNESHAGQVGAVGSWACLSLHSSAESWCQAHRSSRDSPTQHGPTGACCVPLLASPRPSVTWGMRTGRQRGDHDLGLLVAVSRDWWVSGAAAWLILPQEDSASVLGGG